MHKLLDDLSLWDAHIKYRISFMSVYSELYCAKFDICSFIVNSFICLLYTSPSPRDYAASRMPSSA